MGRRRKWENLTDEERAFDLWASTIEDSGVKGEARPGLIKYLKTEARVVRKLAPEVRERRNSPGTPNGRYTSGANIAHAMLQPLAACDWINERDEPVLGRIFRLVAQLLFSPTWKAAWQELFDLIDSLEEVS